MLKIPTSPKTRIPVYIYTTFICMFFATWVVSIIADITWQGDYIAYYTAWKMLLNGDVVHLYDLTAQQQYQEAILGPTRRFADGLLPFVNPPHLMWQLLPLGLLPLLPSYLVWSLLNLVFLILSIRVTLSFVQSWTRQAKALLVVMICGFYPVYITFLLGSFPLFMLLMLLLLFRDSIHGRYWQAGIWLVLASLKFQFILYIGVWLLASRRWRVVLWGMVYGIGLGLVTSLLYGWQVWEDYLRLLGFYGQIYNDYGVNATVPYTLKGTLTTLFGIRYFATINQLAQIMLIIVGAGLFWFFWRNPTRDHIDAGWQYGFALICNLLLSLHINHHDELLLIIPALFFTLWIDQHGMLNRNYLLFMLSSPVILAITDRLIGTALGIQIPTIIKIVLMMWMFRSYRHAHSSHTPKTKQPLTLQA